MSAERPSRSAWLAPAGLGIGFVASMTGVGGGLFAVPLLNLVRRLELRRSVATALVMVFTTALSSTVTEAARSDSNLHAPLIGGLAAGALAGTQLGYRASLGIGARRLRQVFVVAFLAAGARLLFGGGGALDLGAPGGAALDSPATWLAALAVGFGGGFVAPLLGVGGGLIFVPALILTLPALGFAGARACSLATSMVTASRSLWLYAREGAVQARDGLWLAGGALVGAILGVTAVHDPDLIPWARRLLGAVLWVVALRYLLELRGGRDQA